VVKYFFAYCAILFGVNATAEAITVKNELDKDVYCHIVLRDGERNNLGEKDDPSILYSMSGLISAHKSFALNITEQQGGFGEHHNSAQQLTAKIMLTLLQEKPLTLTLALLNPSPNDGKNPLINSLGCHINNPMEMLALDGSTFSFEENLVCTIGGNIIRTNSNPRWKEMGQPERGFAVGFFRILPEGTILPSDKSMLFRMASSDSSSSSSSSSSKVTH
jgi:hypothetical protein